MPSDLPILYLFKVTFRLPSWDCFGQTELGLNVRGCGREAIVCCQGPERTALKLYNFNPGILLGSAGWQAAANEAFQVRCGDRFLSSLKQKSVPLLPHWYSSQFVRGGFWFGGFGWYKATEARRKKNASCSFVLRKAMKEKLYIDFVLAYFSSLWLKTKPLLWLNRMKIFFLMTGRHMKHLFLSTLVAECANHLKHRPHFRELKHNECQYH